MTNFLYFQSIVQYRVPVNDDGTLGTPQITQKFTSPIKGAKEFNRPKKVIKDLQAKSLTEEYI